MSHPLPSAEQLALHELMLVGDASAPSRVFQDVHEYLDEYLQKQFSNVEDKDREEVIADLLLAYFQNPRQYNPEKGSLFNYLRMAAKGDMLNLVQKLKRRASHEVVSLDEDGVEDQFPARNSMIDDEEDEFAQLRHMELGDLIDQLGVTKQDAALVQLMADGERATIKYAEVLNITHLSTTEQQRALSGQHTAALVQYARCCRILDEELAIPPSPETVALYEQIRASEIGPAPRSSGAVQIARRSNIPTAPTSFIGRNKEIDLVLRYLVDPACHVVIITGLGGMGKTRLALEVAAQAVSIFPNVYFVSLVSLNSPDLMPSMIADAIQFSMMNQENFAAELIGYLRDKNLSAICAIRIYCWCSITWNTLQMDWAYWLRLLVTRPVSNFC